MVVVEVWGEEGVFWKRAVRSRKKTGNWVVAPQRQKVFFFRLIRPVLYTKKSKSVFSEKVFFTTKSLFSPYYTKKKSIFLTKTLFVRIIGLALLHHETDIFFEKRFFWKSDFIGLFLRKPTLYSVFHLIPQILIYKVWCRQWRLYYKIVCLFVIWVS